MTLSNDEREALVTHRIEKAKETLKNAEDNALQLKAYAVAANRLYYAVYYAVSALLIKNRLVAHTHAGVKALFYNNFIKTNVFDKESAKFYSKIFELRQSSDYDDFFDLDKEDILPLIEPTKVFICEIERLLQKPHD
jgi:uncharacterized protein (UPF0332 family)